MAEQATAKAEAPEAAPAPAAAGEEGATAEPAKGGKGKLFIILVVVAVLGLGGGAAWYFGVFGHGKKKAHAAKAEGHEGEETAEGEEEGEEGQSVEARPAIGAMVAIDPFIANLGDLDGKRYLKAAIQVEFFAAKEPPEFQARQAQLRDLLLTLFTSKTFDEIRTPSGKALLRDEVVTRINRALNADVVKAVYFTEFIVQ